VGLLPAFPRPGVDTTQLVIQGVSDGEDGWTAVAAVAARLDDPAADTTLTLVATDVLPGSVPPLACAITADFTPVTGGPWSDVPAHNCERSVPAEPASGDRYLFPGVQRLAAGGELRVLIVPGGVGRHVFGAPGLGAIDAAPSSAPPPAAPLDEPLASALSTPVAPLSNDIVVSDVVAPAVTTPAMTPGVDTDASVPVSQYELPAGDFGSRAATAVVLALILGGFTVLQRGSSARLRPAQVRWRRPGGSPGLNG
jgi:hypothetical protein